MKRRKFIPPTLQEAEDYAKSIGYVDFDAGRFIDKNQSIGWVDKNGNKYKDWKAVIRYWQSWSNDKQKKKIKLYPIKGHLCSCGMPAVYKDASGAYDFYYCSEHMPDNVKAKYE